MATDNGMIRNSRVIPRDDDAPGYGISTYIDEDSRERTGPQLPGGAGSKLSQEEIYSQYQQYYKEYQKMLGDPTIAFARMLTVAPLVTAGWSYEEKEEAPPEAKELIQEILEPFRVSIMKSALEGYIDYGWTPWEVVYKPGFGGRGETTGDYIGIEKFKSLLQNQTCILVDINTGAWRGFRQYYGNYAADPNNLWVDLTHEDSLLVTIDITGTDWYGRPLLENARQIYDRYNILEESATRYDTKIAGAHWVIHYPIGKSPYGDPLVLTDNQKIANMVVGTLRSSGTIVVPYAIAKFTADQNNSGGKNVEQMWKIELISDSGKGTTTYIDREKYFDTLKIRAFGIPERAVTEGQFGTKAESEAQADFALTTFEMRHNIVCQQVNKIVTARLMELNFGPEYRDTIQVIPLPLVDTKRAFWQKLYEQFMFNPDVFPNEFPHIDMGAMRKNLGIPEVRDEQQQQEQETLLQMTQQQNAQAEAQPADQGSDWFQ